MPDVVQAPDPVRCALFLILAFILAGVAQTWWFKSPRSARFAIPLDGGRTFRGWPIFGANKTWKGFVVMVPVTALAFLVLGTLARALPIGKGLWSLSPAGYALLGAVASIGFMAGELPNSFIKRQLAIPPGGAPRSRGARCVARASSIRTPTSARRRSWSGRCAPAGRRTGRSEFSNANMRLGLAATCWRRTSIGLSAPRRTATASSWTAAGSSLTGRGRTSRS